MVGVPRLREVTNISNVRVFRVLERSVDTLDNEFLRFLDIAIILENN